MASRQWFPSEETWYNMQLEGISLRKVVLVLFSHKELHTAGKRGLLRKRFCLT